MALSSAFGSGHNAAGPSRRQPGARSLSATVSDGFSDRQGAYPEHQQTLICPARPQNGCSRHVQGDPVGQGQPSANRRPIFGLWAVRRLLRFLDLHPRARGRNTVGVPKFGETSPAPPRAWTDIRSAMRISCPGPGVLSRNRRNFRHPSSSPATSASKSIILPSLWKV